MTEDRFKELFYKQKYGPSQNYFELSSLFYWIDRYLPNPKRIIEIGVFAGGTLRFWREILDKEGLLLGIDLNDRGYLHEVRQEYSQDKRVQFITGLKSNDNECIKRTKEIVGNQLIDILHIDGNHSLSIVQDDFNKYQGFVRRGGLIIFHDIIGPEFMKGTVVWLVWKNLICNVLHLGHIEFFGGISPCGIGVFIKA